MAEKAATKVKRPTALKRVLQNRKANLRNRMFKSRVRTALRQFEDAVAEKSKEKSEASLKLIYSLMDQGAKQNTFKQNKASRTKSRLAARVAAL
jgi:small subunit ribosomal protein S20